MKKKDKILRVNEEIHKKAKLAACYKMIPLQQWIEELIECEFKDQALSLSKTHTN